MLLNTVAYTHVGTIPWQVCLQNSTGLKGSAHACGWWKVFSTSLGCHVLLQVHKELGMTLTPIEETYIDMATTMIAVGVAKPMNK